MDSILGWITIFSDTVDDGGHTRSNGVWFTPRADQYRVGPISFVAWVVDQHLIASFETWKRQSLIDSGLLIRSLF